MRGKGVPSLARRLLAMCTPAEDRPFVLADLEDAYRSRWTERGRAAAWRWYWWQALRAVPSAWSARRGEATAVAGASGRGFAGADVRLAVRAFVRRPLYAAGVAGTLGLGLGAAAAVFAVAWGIWFRPLPFPDADGVVHLYEVNLRPDGEGDAPLMATSAAGPSRWNRLSPPLLADLQRASLSTIEHVAAVSGNTLDWLDGDRIERVQALLVSPELFDILSVKPLHGRAPRGGLGEREVVLTEAFWRRAFGADPVVVQRSMELDGETYAIVGIIAAPAGYPESADVWSPLTFEESALAEGMRGARYLDVVARVRPGRTVADAAAEMDAFVRGLAESHPMHRAFGGHAVAVRQDLVRPFRSVLIMLLAAGAAFVLLATVNVAGLVAARRAETRHARAIRLALGASHGRILREGIVESTLLGATGALLAGAGATWLLAPVKRLIPQDVPRLAHVSVSPGILLSLLVAGTVVGVLVGLLGHLMSGIRDRPSAGRNRDADRPGVRGRRALLITQVALTTWLLIGGIGLLRYVNSLRAVDVGFRPGGVLSAPITLSALRQGAAARLATQQESADRARVFWQQVLDALEARGVQAAVATNAPISGSNMRFGYAIQGDDSEHWGQYRTVTPGYFDVLGTDIVRGRVFSAADDAGGAPVVIVNEALANAHYPNQDPVGRRLRVVGTQRTIVGVARSTRHFGPDREPPAEMYVPLAQDPWPFVHVLVREGNGVTPDLLAQVIATIDPAQPVPPLVPFERFVTSWFAPLRLQLTVLGGFAGVGATLAALGIYALVAYLVSNRQREIGIRLALGERYGTVFGRVLAGGLSMTLIGALLGIAAAAASGELLGRLIAGLDTGDPATMLLVLALVTAIALMACVLPARRAIAVDPIVTLRAE